MGRRPPRPAAVRVWERGRMDRPKILPGLTMTGNLPMLDAW